MATNVPKHESDYTTWYSCVGCGKSFLGWMCAPRKYCDRKCASTYQNKDGKTDVRLCFKRKYGDDWESYFNAWREKISKATKGDRNPNYGNGSAWTLEMREKIGSRTRGKTLVDLYGEDRATQIRNKQSHPGERNPSYGKTYSRGGRSVKGYYKGHFFRSLLEYSFMKHLESRGLSLDKDVKYEAFDVPYVLDGVNRTYRVDFHVIPDKMVYEVKPRYIAKSPNAETKAKWDAAIAFFTARELAFAVKTEDDFKKHSFNEVYNVDREVKWDERTFEYFKKT